MTLTDPHCGLDMSFYGGSTIKNWRFLRIDMQKCGESDVE
jgi:hypothetical protein